MQPKRKRRLKIFGIVAGSLLALILYVAYSLGLIVALWDSPAYGNQSPIVSIEIETINWRLPKETRSTFVTTSDAAVIDKIVNTMNSGGRVSNCRCLWSGFVRLTTKSGKLIEVQLVPGHEDGNYDIREGRRRYRIDRHALASALEGAGATLPDFK